MKKAKLENRAYQMEKNINDIKDRNLEIIQMEVERDMRGKEIEELYKNHQKK